MSDRGEQARGLRVEAAERPVSKAGLASLMECRRCNGKGEVAATPGQPGDGSLPCPACDGHQDREIRWWRSVIGDAIFGLRHQPEVSRDEIAEALVGRLLDGMPDDA